MLIKELRNGMSRVSVEAKVDSISPVREVISRYSGRKVRVATAVISDESGTVNLTLWEDQIDKVSVGDAIKIENGYVNTFRGDLQLNVGRYGTLSVVE
ncbi:MAG: OB-fold nucleic acid binding domain-containing protein [Candidatus Geothermarchaeales archaeon]